MMANTAAASMTIPISTDSIISACIEGDRTAQKKLYVNYCDAMYTLAYRITKNHELANDSLQDAFIEVFKNIKSYDGSGTIGSWIKTIVVRKAIKTIKYEKSFNNNWISLSHHIMRWSLQHVYTRRCSRLYV